MTESIYSGFDSRADVAAQFNTTIADDVHILIAHYETGDYEGSAFVLFRRDGKLYEVHGSHCSCYGLEDQFDPIETTVESILHRINNGDAWAFAHADRDAILSVLPQ